MYSGLFLAGCWFLYFSWLGPAFKMGLLWQIVTFAVFALVFIKIRAVIGRMHQESLKANHSQAAREHDEACRRCNQARERYKQKFENTKHLKQVSAAASEISTAISVVSAVADSFTFGLAGSALGFLSQNMISQEQRDMEQRINKLAAESKVLAGRTDSLAFRRDMNGTRTAVSCAIVLVGLLAFGLQAPPRVAYINGLRHSAAGVFQIINPVERVSRLLAMSHNNDDTHEVVCGELHAHIASAPALNANTLKDRSLFLKAIHLKIGEFACEELESKVTTGVLDVERLRIRVAGSHNSLLESIQSLYGLVGDVSDTQAIAGHVVEKIGSFETWANEPKLTMEQGNAIIAAADWMIGAQDPWDRLKTLVPDTVDDQAMKRVVAARMELARRLQEGYLHEVRGNESINVDAAFKNLCAAIKLRGPDESKVITLRDEIHERLKAAVTKRAKRLLNSMSKRYYRRWKAFEAPFLHEKYGNYDPRYHRRRKDWVKTHRDIDPRKRRWKVESVAFEECSARAIVTVRAKRRKKETAKIFMCPAGEKQEWYPCGSKSILEAIE